MDLKHFLKNKSIFRVSRISNFAFPSNLPRFSSLQRSIYLYSSYLCLRTSAHKQSFRGLYYFLEKKKKECKQFLSKQRIRLAPTSLICTLESLGLISHEATKQPPPGCADPSRSPPSSQERPFQNPMGHGIPQSSFPDLRLSFPLAKASPTQIAAS